jgi:PAS domain S-box-containing protein
VAAKALCAGADDYFTKNQGFAHIERLANSIIRHSQRYVEQQEKEMLERQSRQLEENSRLMFENSISAIALHKIITDEQGKPVDYIFEQVNKAFEEQTGLKSAGIVGKRVTEILPGIGAEGFDWISAYGEVALTGKSHHIEEFSKQLDRWYEVHAYSPKEGHFVTTFFDITDRKLALERLKESERRFRSLFKYSHLVMLIIDPKDGSILDANEAAASFYGWSIDELTSMWMGQINKFSREKLDSLIQKAMKREKDIYHLRHQCADGRARDVEVFIEPITIENRNLLYSIVIPRERMDVMDLIPESPIQKD